MPIVRILLVLLALASPALAQDGAHDAAAAREAAQAFRVYVEGVTKTNGRPDLTRPEVAALLEESDRPLSSEEREQITTAVRRLRAEGK